MITYCREVCPDRGGPDCALPSVGTRILAGVKLALTEAFSGAATAGVAERGGVAPAEIAVSICEPARLRAKNIYTGAALCALTHQAAEYFASE